MAVEYGSLGAIFAFKEGHAQQTYREQEELFQRWPRARRLRLLCGRRLPAGLAKMHPESKLRLMTLQGNDLEFPVGIGMRKADTDLKEGVDEVATTRPTPRGDRHPGALMVFPSPPLRLQHTSL